MVWTVFCSITFLTSCSFLQRDQPEVPPVRGGDQPDGRQRAGAEQVQRPHRVRAAQQQLVKVKARRLIHH